MPAKATAEPTDPAVVDQWDGGVGWIAHPEETMERASHALSTDEGVWLVDPLEAPGIADLLGDLGEVAGVILLSNYHLRDADVFAERNDVPVTLPASMTDLEDRLDAPVSRLEVGTAVGGYELFTVARSSCWQEYGLADGETLVVGESVGTAEYLRAGEEALGVMLLRRLTPPRAALAGRDPDRVLAGHGPGLQEDAGEALEEALRNARRRFPRALLENGRRQLGTVIAAVRT
jgi:glyoxylase-like metal-dependent hydrolase (beta-lactamase superfamily II)